MTCHSMMKCIWLLPSLLAILIITAQLHPAAADGCPERPACHGCGCKGGPGYRAPDGHCVGFKALAHTCGTPPSERCTFENAPGTGANAECAMQSHSRRQQPAHAGASLPVAEPDADEPATPN